MPLVTSSSPIPGCAASLPFVWQLATYVQPSRMYATYGRRYRRVLLLRWGLLKGEDQMFASSQATPTPQGGGKLTPIDINLREKKTARGSMWHHERTIDVTFHDPQGDR